MKWIKRVPCGLLCAALLLVMLPGAYAEQPGRITADMTMGEIRNDPDVQKTGIYLSGSFGEGTSLTRDRFDSQPLKDYAWSGNAEKVAAALNLAAENAEAGVQVTHQVYSAEEIEEDASLGCVQLYYFPGKNPGGKYALVLSGNALTINGTVGEGLPTAWELHEMGYTVFLLRYRAWLDLGGNAPLNDLGRAVKYITDHAAEFHVNPEQYALLGYSSGGQIAGIFAGKEHGYARFGVPKPGTLILGYPVAGLSVLKPVYRILYDPAECGWRYYGTEIGKAVDDGYPPVYYWRGDNDTILGLISLSNAYTEFEAALQAHHIVYQKTYYANAPHAISVGSNTDAEGWLKNAAAFWEEQTK